MSVSDYHRPLDQIRSASLGTVMMDNYKLNRWLKNDDPDFSASDFLRFTPPVFHQLHEN